MGFFQTLYSLRHQLTSLAENINGTDLLGIAIDRLNPEDRIVRLNSRRDPDEFQHPTGRAVYSTDMATLETVAPTKERTVCSISRQARMAILPLRSLCTNWAEHENMLVRSRTTSTEGKRQSTAKENKDKKKWWAFHQTSGHDAHLNAPTIPSTKRQGSRAPCSRK